MVAEGLLFRFGLCVRNVFTGEGFELAADQVGGEAGAQEAPVEPSELAIIDFAAGGAQLALDALADEGGFVGLLRGFFEGGFNVAVGDAAGAKVACNTKLALLSSFGALAGELLGVTVVVNQAAASEASQDVFDKCSIFAAALERPFHLVNGVRAPHEDFDGGVVQGGFGIELAGLGEHEERIEEEAASG